MRIMAKASLLLTLLVMVTAACVTVNIYFPAAEVEKAAEKIVDDVYGEKGAPQNKPAPGDKSALPSLFAWLAPRAAHAADATSVSNAAIRALKSEIAGHHSQLAPFYAKGAVGITRDGMLAVRDTQGLPLNEVAQLKRLVSADNQARQRLYQEVTKAMNLQPSQVGQVKGVFANVWRDKAQGGWWVQADNGSWHKK